MTREKLPDFIANAPSLFDGLELFYKGFMDLTSCRQQGYASEGPITWFNIHYYCEINDIKGEQKEDFHYHIEKMDSAYLEYRGKKNAATLNSMQSPKGKKR